MTDKIKIVFRRVLVKNDEDWLGEGEFYFIANVDGIRAGNADVDCDAIEGQFINLPQP